MRRIQTDSFHSQINSCGDLQFYTDRVEDFLQRAGHDKHTHTLPLHSFVNRDYMKELFRILISWHDV